MSDLVQGLEKALKGSESLDSLAKPLQKSVRGIFKGAGSAGQAVANFLHGVWLGHPLHPVLTDIPIGAWTAGVALDMMQTGSGSPGMAKAADTAIGIGVAGAGAAALAGITDWMHVDGEARRTGLVHALLNTVALSLFIGSLIARKGGSRGTGKALALIGYGIAGTSAYLGGDLVFRQKIGVNHAPQETPASHFTPLVALDALPEGRLTRVFLGDTPLVVLRRGSQVFAVAERCSHLGGPLAEGELGTTADGRPTVTCPWHGSRFQLDGGNVIDGPATYPQPCFETRVSAGFVEVRRAEAP